eukprot:GHRQ01023038.1.p1 GENE.GHRQ01023038.1~~GHRQ01023038.1.p1  ORF type:complete len:372 (+),score=104.51 GHRQ01023038.1:227-1342(+)
MPACSCPAVVAPGMYFVGQQSIACPKGKYQPRYLAKTALSAKACLSCPRGKTTRATGAISPTQCSALKAGFYVLALAAPGNSTSSATPSPIVEVQECPEGTYQPYEGEVPVFNCTACGLGLKTDTTGSVSGDACYVDEGYGSRAEGGVLTAYPCPADTFRQLVAYGITPLDCEPCATGTSTQGRTGTRSEAGCDGHAAGYGLNDVGIITQCPVGYFNPASPVPADPANPQVQWLPCTACKFGRSTLNDPAKQAATTDCLPKPGYGLQLPEGSFSFTFEQLQAEAAARQLNTSALLAELPMELCPEGTFSAPPTWAAGLDATAKALAQTCQTCSNGAVTTPGSNGATSCSRVGEAAWLCCAGCLKVTHMPCA